MISDNDSTDDIAGYVERSDGFTGPLRPHRPVRTGDGQLEQRSPPQHRRLRVMLGDDDALLPGTLSALRTVIKRFAMPEAVYVGALLFAYPGVLPDAPAVTCRPSSPRRSSLVPSDPSCSSLGRHGNWCDAALDFRARYDFNMQYVAVSRETVRARRDDGDFFRSPFPDYLRHEPRVRTHAPNRGRSSSARGRGHHTELARLLPLQPIVTRGTRATVHRPGGA